MPSARAPGTPGRSRIARSQRKQFAVSLEPFEDDGIAWADLIANNRRRQTLPGVTDGRNGALVRRGVNPAVMLECPSPDRSLLAVLFWQGGGGAAGWAEFVLTLQPANVPVTRPPTGPGGVAQAVLTASSAQRFELNWIANDHLSVSVAYPDLATVSYLFHQYPMNGPLKDRTTE